MSSKSLSVPLSLVLSLGALAPAGCASNRNTVGGVSGAEQFARLKSLQGDWIGDPAPGMEAPPRVSYRATAGGSALVETIFSGTPHEMQTIYHLGGGDLVMTHYCVLGNQPHMVAQPAPDLSAITFECKQVFNGSQDQLHMHHGVIQFLDDGRVRSEWRSLNQGQLAEPVVIEIHRAD